VTNEDKASRYHRLKRRTWLAGTALGALFLLILLFSGASVAIREQSVLFARGSFTLTIVIYVVMLAILSEALQLPLAFYQGVILERRYGLSTQTTGRWCIDHAKAGIIALVFSVAAATFVWHLLRSTPDTWWFSATIGLSAVLILLAHLAPVLLLPLFYELKPLDRPALRDRLAALAQRAGARVLGVFEWRLSDRTRKANAALMGIGRTRRILVSDTLLADHSDDEIEVILAHELAHHVHGDIWKGIALEAGLILAGFRLADMTLAKAVSWFGFSGKADIAAVPLLILAGGVVSVILMPVANAWSRAHERRADRYALDMTRNPDAFITAMKRLGTQNLAEQHPSWLVQTLFYTHPPLAARIGTAHTWMKESEDQRYGNRAEYGRTASPP
jgi:Zn-dependent protease with chaperone function